MSKMSELSLVLDELISCGENLIKTAREIKEIFSDTAAEAAPVREEAKEPEKEAKTYTFTEVRAIMAALSGKGKKAEARAILQKYGVSRLSELPEEAYAAVAEEAQVIANG